LQNYIGKRHLKIMQEIKEFKVNKYLKLKLENGKTNIYIKGELFINCKYLLLNLPEDSNTKTSLLSKINSIDEAADSLDNSLEELEGVTYKISPEVEFWAHSSNLQAWSENGYDTRLLHSNISFPLLRKLTSVGDPLAKKIFKEEVANRFIFGNEKIQRYLKGEGFLDILSKEEILSLVEGGDIILALERSLGKNIELNFLRYPNPRGVVIEEAKITWLSLNDSELTKLPEILIELKDLKGLIFKRNSLKTLPQWIGNSTQLKHLDVSNNQLEDLPDSIGDLKNLKKLDFSHNKLKRLPESIGNLRKLEVLFANNNEIINLPESIGKLQMLKDLVISTNFLKTIPESIGNLKMLKNLTLSNNHLETLPKSIGLLSALKFLMMGENRIRELPSSINHLENLQTLSLKGIDEGVWNLSDYMKKKVRIYK